MKTLILAEKDNQAEAYAKALGTYQKVNHIYIITETPYLEGEVHIVAPEGHLFEYMDPEDNWNLDKLPLLDFSFKMQLKKGKIHQQRFNRIYREVEWADKVIIGTDSEREGERIAYSILSRIPDGIKKISKRIWAQTLSPRGLREAFKNLKDPSETYDLYLEAEARARSDWLVGMNLSPLVTLALQNQNVLAKGKGNSLSVGRVQSPTIRLVCENDTRIRQFQPQPYWKLFLEDKQYQVSFAGTEKFESSEQALQTARTLDRVAEVLDVVEEDVVKAPPSLFDTASLQSYASSHFKIDTQQSLEILDKLYHEGVLSYPRTGSSYITTDEFDYLVEHISAYKHHLGLPIKVDYLEPRQTHVDPEKLDEDSHYGLIPTEKLPDLSQLSKEERLIYETIVKRTLLMFASNYHGQTQKVVLGNQGNVFKAQVKRTLSSGWAEWHGTKPKNDVQLLPYRVGQKVYCLSGVQELSTKPPKRITEAELFGSVLKKYGLGTPATRTAIFQKTLDMGYIRRDKKTGQLFPDRKAYVLVNFMYNNEFSNPETTGGWEDFLHQIGQGKLEPGEFVDAIKDKLREQVEAVKEGGHF